MPDIYLIYCTIMIVSDSEIKHLHYWQTNFTAGEIMKELSYIPAYMNPKEMLYCKMTFGI